MECLRHHHQAERLVALAVLLLTVALGVATAQTATPTQAGPTPKTPTPTPIPSPTPTPTPVPGEQLVALSPDQLSFGDHDIGTTSYGQGLVAKNNGKTAVT